MKNRENKNNLLELALIIFISVGLFLFSIPIV